MHSKHIPRKGFVFAPLKKTLKTRCSGPEFHGEKKTFMFNLKKKLSNLVPELTCHASHIELVLIFGLMEI